MTNDLQSKPSTQLVELEFFFFKLTYFPVLLGIVIFSGISTTIYNYMEEENQIK